MEDALRAEWRRGEGADREHMVSGLTRGDIDLGPSVDIFCFRQRSLGWQCEKRIPTLYLKANTMFTIEATVHNWKEK